MLVSGSPPAGFARLEIVDGQAHLEQLSVLPASSRAGIGTALLEAAVDWARQHGYAWLTLITFRDVTWNAPFYAARGFTPVADDDLGPGLRVLRRLEREEDGMDAMGARVVMRRSLRH